ncbi:peptide ABC transporter substrate-binding protein [Peribacillus tepidiphilus]|uniref:peptide ABC transporter substrate-binding protein n=1 Tax=Peribacillus tepidiphilus TaxID=2652445 RepID=UPI0035B4FD6B
MKKSKFSLFLILTLVLSMFLAACSGGNKKEEAEGSKEGTTKEEAPSVPQELKVLDSSEIPTMDSTLAEGSTSFLYLNQVSEGLYRIDQNQEPVLALAAEEPQVSEDGKVYTFKLRDAKWSNGDPITAHDFVFAWQRAIDPKTASPYGPYLMGGKIKGAQEITDAAAAKKPYDVNTLGIKALDDKTLEITLEKPIPFFKSLMAFATFHPINKKFFESTGGKYASNAENLLASGPFKMTDWDGPADTDWVMEKNENYWDAENVKLTKITTNVVKDSQAAVNAFEAGEADITPKLSSDIVPQYEGDDRLLRYLETTVFWLKLNQKNEALANENIRRAIAMAFNKEDLVNSILNNGSVPANYAVPAESFKLDGKDFREKNGDMLTYNVEEAKKYWEQGLKELGKKELTIRYLGGDTETAKKTDEYMINQLETNLPGLKIKLESVPFAVRLERDNKQDYDIQFAGWGADYLDPISFSDLWITNGGSNRMNYSNPEYDKLIKAAMGELSDKPAERWEALQEAERILLEEDAGIAPVYQRATNLLIAPKVKGFVYHNVGADYSFKWIEITE